MLMGAGDALFNTQLLTIVNDIFTRDSGNRLRTAAYSVANLTRALTSGLCYFLASVLPLHHYSYAMLAIGALAVGAFVQADRELQRGLYAQWSSVHDILDMAMPTQLPTLRAGRDSEPQTRRLSRRLSYVDAYMHNAPTAR